MPAEHILTQNAPAPLPGIYSQAVKAGPFLYTSGSVGMTTDGKMVEGSVGDRTTQVLSNLKNVLAAAGYGLEHVVKANIYLGDLERDFNAMNEVWKATMPDPKPARTCVGVAKLPAGGTDVEIEFVCYKE